MHSRPVTAPVAALALSVALGSALLAQPREFPHVRELGGALVEYNDGITQAVAAYYHSQRHHDGKWLLIELGMMSRQALDARSRPGRARHAGRARAAARQPAPME